MIDLLFLSKEDVEATDPRLCEVMDAIEMGLEAHGGIGEIVAGIKPGRTSEHERILFWHKGFAISDIVLGHLVYRKAREQGIGTMLTYFEEPRDM